MKTKFIKIHGIVDVTNFAKEAFKVNGDICLRRGKYTVDGKSLMGIMSIDVASGVVVEYPDDAEDFENFIKQFEI